MDSSRLAALLAPFLGGATLSDIQLTQLRNYLDLLLRWNARMNLTAIRDPEPIVTRHFGESLFAARHLYSQLATRNSQLVDIGSGAGFPGLPIKIWAPALPLTLLESIHRKATFLREVVRALHLQDVEVLTDRAENYAAAIATRRSPVQQKSNVGPGALAGAAAESHQVSAAAGAPPAANVTVTFRAVEHFETILPTAVRLLRNFPATGRFLALLIGSAQVPAAHQFAPSLAWSDPLPIPQSSNRVLLVGQSP